MKITPAPDPKEFNALVARAKEVIKIESQAVAGLADHIDENFVHLVLLIAKNDGHLVVTGMGKSGLIGNKIASTFSSIGVPAFFLHAAEASHGDLGMISKRDIILAISNSGETEEILKLLPTFHRLGVPVAAMTGNPDSTLGKRSDYVLNVAVKEEACSLGLVPTSSATAALAMGDALALTLLEKQGFKEEDFAVNHPGGSLGRRLLTTVNDIMHTGDEIPMVSLDSPIYEVIQEMSRKGFGTTAVVDDSSRIQGVITDGDLRRLIESRKPLAEAQARDVMAASPKLIKKDNMAARALQIMEEHSITSLMVSEDNSAVDGIIHLHDLLKSGIV